MIEDLIEIVSDDVLEDMDLISYFGKSIHLRLSIQLKLSFFTLLWSNKFSKTTIDVGH